MIRTCRQFVQTALSRWLKGSQQKSRKKASRFRPSFESLESRECPAQYVWTYPGGVPSAEESWFNLDAWRVNGQVPSVAPTLFDDVVLGAAGANMSCRVGAGDAYAQSIEMQASYQATLHVRWEWTLTVSGGLISQLFGGTIELGGKYIENGPDNHSHGILIFENTRVQWGWDGTGGPNSATNITASTVNWNDPHSYNREGDVILQNSVLECRGPTRQAQAEWLVTSPGSPDATQQLGKWAVLDTMSGNFLFGKGSIVRIDVDSFLSWENFGTDVMAGSFRVPEGNLRYLINYGTIERNAPLVHAEGGGAPVTPRIVELQFPVLLTGDSAHLLLSYGELRIAPTRTGVSSVEGTGRLGLAPGTALWSPRGVSLLDSTITLLPCVAEGTGTTAIISGTVDLVDSTVDLGIEAYQAGYYTAPSSLSASGWRFQNSRIQTLFFSLGPFPVWNYLVSRDFPITFMGICQLHFGWDVEVSIPLGFTAIFLDAPNGGIDGSEVLMVDAMGWTDSNTGHEMVMVPEYFEGGLKMRLIDLSLI